MKFSKMHGVGNDYVYVNCMDFYLENPSKLAISISDRHKGIGSDGLIMIQPSKKADFYMRMFNADGSEGSMCGNGIRCVAKFVYDNRLTNKLLLDIETKSGIKHLQLFTKDNLVESVEVDMGVAYLRPSQIPLVSDDETYINKPLLVEGKKYVVTCLSVGNPHCIIFMNNETNKNNLRYGLEQLELDRIGPAFENHELFPDKINTEFIEVIDSKTLKMRVYERGSGETMACGTGACATVVAAVLNGICERNRSITVKLRGGDLEIRYLDNGHIMMKGEAVHVFDGEIDISQ